MYEVLLGGEGNKKRLCISCVNLLRILSEHTFSHGGKWKYNLKTLMIMILTLYVIFLPPCFNTDILGSKFSIAALNLERSVVDKDCKYFSASNNALPVRYRFLPAILMEFPSAESSD